MKRDCYLESGWEGDPYSICTLYARSPCNMDIKCNGFEEITNTNGEPELKLTLTGIPASISRSCYPKT